MNEHQLLLGYAKQLLELAEEPIGIGIKTSDDLKGLKYGFLVATTKNLEATIMLLENGYVSEAFVLTRSMFEALVNLKYISLDPDARFKLWMNFDIIAKQKMVKNRPSLIQDGKREVVFQEKFTELKCFYKDKNRWSGVTIEEMAKDCGLSDMYKVEYTLLCLYSHVSVESIDEYLEIMDGCLKAKIDQSFNDEFTFMPLWISVACFSKLLREVEEIFIKETFQKLLPLLDATSDMIS